MDTAFDYIEVHFRIKHCPGIHLENTYKHFIKNKTFKRVIVSLETSGGEHIHGQVSISPSDITLRTLKENIRNYIKELYPTAKGNKCLYVKEISNTKQSIKYVLKEGNFLYYGFTQKYIQQLYKLSTNKENLKDKIVTNEENLLLGKITYPQFCIEYIQIKIDHNQRINKTHLQGYFNLYKLKSGETSVRQFWENNFLSYY